MASVVVRYRCFVVIFVERENMGKSHVINLIINSVRACFVLFGLLAYLANCPVLCFFICILLYSYCVFIICILLYPSVEDVLRTMPTITGDTKIPVSSHNLLLTTLTQPGPHNPSFRRRIRLLGLCPRTRRKRRYMGKI